MSVLVLAAVLLNCAATTYACGGQILGQSFDKYSGGYTKWTKPMAKEDFDGLIFLKFDDFAEVGEGHLRVKNPAGAPALCFFMFRRLASYRSCMWASHSPCRERGVQGVWGPADAAPRLT